MSRKQTNYGAQYDLVAIDDVRELAMRRALDRKVSVVTPQPNPGRALLRTLIHFARCVVLIIALHLLIFIFALTRK